MASIARDAAKPPRAVFWLVVLIGLSVLLNYVDRGAIGVAAPLMKSELGLSATGFGVAVSAFFWVYAPMNLAVGWLCDRFCVYRIFAAGVAIWALSTFLTGFIGGIAMLLVFRLFLGLGEAIAFPGSSKIFAAEVPAAHRGMANAVVGAALAFGPAVGTLAGGVILGLAGWREIFWIFGAVTLLWLIPWHFASRPFRSESLTQAIVAPIPIRRLLRIPALWLMSAAHFMSNYGFYFLLAWLPLFLVETRGYSIAEMTVLASTGLVAQGFSALISGRISDILVVRGVNEATLRRWIMALGQLMLGLSIGGVFLADGADVLLFWLVLGGIGTGVVSVNIFAVAQMFGGPKATGGWVGVQNTLGNTAGIVGPVITGLIIDRLGGYEWAFIVAAGVTLLGAFWWLFVVPPIREVSQE
ncbi:MAG: MFS transporter [Alphaproteobacteria bacterium]|nr:MAG: MFS transporter [Alphaproteobacteria bacterium]